MTPSRETENSRERETQEFVRKEEKEETIDEGQYLCLSEVESIWILLK